MLAGASRASFDRFGREEKGTYRRECVSLGIAMVCFGVLWCVFFRAIGVMPCVTKMITRFAN